MKTKKYILISILLFGINFICAQTQEDLQKLSIFSEYVKAKNYNDAYAPWMELRIATPRLNKAIYVFGERILKDKISNSKGQEKITYILDLLKLWEERRALFPNITPQGTYLAKASQLRYDNKKTPWCIQQEFICSF
jgi:hypothetical protein